jgi:hypothetical protein
VILFRILDKAMKDVNSTGDDPPNGSAKSRDKIELIAFSMTLLAGLVLFGLSTRSFRSLRIAQSIVVIRESKRVISETINVVSESVGGYTKVDPVM